MMLFSKAEIVFMSVFVLALGGYRIYTKTTKETAGHSKWYAAGYFLCAGLDLFTVFWDLRRGIAPGDLIPHFLIVILFIVFGALELWGAKKKKNS